MAAAAAFYGLSAVATAGTTSKPYFVTDSLNNGAPSSTGVSVAAGTTNAFSFAITDNTSTQGIGSAEIVPPNGFTIDPNSLSVPPGATASLTNGTSCPLDQVSPTPSPLTCVIVNNLTITPGGTEAISFSAATSCAASASSTFGLQVQQANQFSGKPGNQMGPLTDPPALNVAVSNSCTLQFVTEPADANPSTTISNQSYTAIPPAQPIEVEALAGGNPVSGVPVTLAIDLANSPDPGKGAQLAGAPVTSTAANGIASFGGANIAVPGQYVLQASSPGFQTVDSTPATGFLVGSGAACTPGVSCSANTNDPKNGQNDNLTVTSTTNGEITVIVGLDAPPASCTDGASHAPDVTTTSATTITANGKNLSVTFSSKLGAGHFQVCWTDGVQTVDPLGACGKITAPVQTACLVSPISKDNSTGLINEDIMLPPGDASHSW